MCVQYSVNVTNLAFVSGDPAVGRIRACFGNSNATGSQRFEIALHVFAVFLEIRESRSLPKTTRAQALGSRRWAADRRESLAPAFALRIAFEKVFAATAPGHGAIIKRGHCRYFKSTLNRSRLVDNAK
jgi:hypothetical protein